MQKCCINGCDANTRDNPDLSFFRFPKNEARNLLWINRIGKKNIKVAAAIKICSQHFEANFINRTLNVVRLKDDAVPTLFPFTSPSLQSRTTLGNTINKIKMPQPMDIDTINPFNVKQMQLTSIVDSTEHKEWNTTREKKNTIVNHKKLEYINKKMAIVMQKQRKKIKTLQQTCRRLRHKVHTLQNNLEELEKQNLVDRGGVIWLEEHAGSPEFLEVSPDF